MILVKEASTEDGKLNLWFIRGCFAGSNLIYYDLCSYINIKSLKNEVKRADLMCKFIL